jgi:hypothetical protein
MIYNIKTEFEYWPPVENETYKDYVFRYINNMSSVLRAIYEEHSEKSENNILESLNFRQSFIPHDDVMIIVQKFNVLLATERGLNLFTSRLMRGLQNGEEVIDIVRNNNEGCTCQVIEPTKH